MQREQNMFLNSSKLISTSLTDTRALMRLETDHIILETWVQIYIGLVQIMVIYTFFLMTVQKSCISPCANIAAYSENGSP